MKLSLSLLTPQYLAIIVTHAGVHRDKNGAAGVEGELDPLKHELFDVVGHGVLDGVDLLGHHREDSQLNSEYKYFVLTDPLKTKHESLQPVKFVKAGPSSGLGQTFEELPHGVVVEPVRTVEDDALLPSGFGQVLAGLRLPGAGHALHSSA